MNLRETVNLIRYVYGLCLSSVFGGCLGVSIGQLYLLFMWLRGLSREGVCPLVRAAAVKGLRWGCARGGLQRPLLMRGRRINT